MGLSSGTWSENGSLSNRYYEDSVGRIEVQTDRQNFNFLVGFLDQTQTGCEKFTWTVKEVNKEPLT